MHGFQARRAAIAQQRENAADHVLSLEAQAADAGRRLREVRIRVKAPTHALNKTQNTGTHTL